MLKEMNLALADCIVPSKIYALNMYRRQNLLEAERRETCSRFKKPFFLSCFLCYFLFNKIFLYLVFFLAINKPFYRFPNPCLFQVFQSHSKFSESSKLGYLQMVLNSTIFKSFQRRSRTRLPPITKSFKTFPVSLF